MPSTSNRQASIDSRRIALEREITIRVPRFDTFVTQYSTNISTTGMFIVSEKPHAPGTTFTFEFSVADDWKLIRGKAQVVWTRYRNEDSERPAGMGVRFVELDAQSRRLIRWIVEKHIREGGKPFELDDLRNVIDEALEDVIESDDAADGDGNTLPISHETPTRARPTATRPPGSNPRATERRIFPLVATAAVIVVGLACLFWLTEWLPDHDAEAGESVTSLDLIGGESEEISNGPNAVALAGRTSEEQTGASDEGKQEAGSVADPSAATHESEAALDRKGVVTPPLGSAYTGVREALTTWSSAWSAQDVAGYLAAYSREYKPAGLSRSAWKAQRRERLTSPDYIKVSISQLDMVRVRDNLVRVTFFQSYRSNRFSDSVGKVFELVWEDGGWKILTEQTR